MAAAAWDWECTSAAQQVLLCIYSFVFPFFLPSLNYQSTHYLVEQLIHLSMIYSPSMHHHSLCSFILPSIHPSEHPYMHLFTNACSSTFFHSLIYPFNHLQTSIYRFFHQSPNHPFLLLSSLCLSTHLSIYPSTHFSTIPSFFLTNQNVYPCPLSPFLNPSFTLHLNWIIHPSCLLSIHPVPIHLSSIHPYICLFMHHSIHHSTLHLSSPLSINS